MLRARRLARPVALAVVATAVLTSCATPAGPAETAPAGTPTPSSSETVAAPPVSPGTLQPSDVVGVRWHPAAEWLDETVTEDGMGNTRTPFVELLADGSVVGSDGCNGASGRWTLTDGHLAVELGPRTLIACAGPAVPSLLAKAQTVARDGDALILTLDDGSEGRLVPAAG